MSLNPVTMAQRLLIAWMLTLVCAAKAADRPANSHRPPPPPAAGRTCEVVLKPADLMRHVDYLASPELKGRSGPEAELAAKYIVFISGSYSNVVGLPLHETAQMLKAARP